MASKAGAAFFHCFSCHKVTPLGEQPDVCASCGSNNGNALTKDDASKLLDAGTIYNIDPRTGGRAKRKRR